MPGAEINRCLIGVRTTIGRDVSVTNSILLGADKYETEAERSHNRSIKVPDIGIGHRVVIKNAIIDKDCRIGNDVRIVNRAKVEDGEGENFVIRSGIVVIPRGSVLPDGMEI